jgi:hypothetical protein
MIKKITFMLLGIVLLAGCSTISTQPDQVGLHYDAGSFSDTKFENCVKSGELNVDGPGDEHFVYPAGVRTYKFADASGAEQAPISVTTKDNVQMTSAGILGFEINTDCKTLREFHEAIGLKYEVDADGIHLWKDLMNDYLGQQLQDTMNAAAANYTVDELYADANSRAAWGEDVKKNLPAAVRNFAGGDYFDHFTLVLQRPLPPQAYLDQLQEQQVQRERLDTIDAQKAAQTAELEQIQQLVQTFGGWEGYIAYRNQVQCENNSDSCVQFLPIPQGSGVNVTPGG